jgi:branched-chain amino acid transport system substrate-binding protein
MRMAAAAISVALLATACSGDTDDTDDTDTEDTTGTDDADDADDSDDTDDAGDDTASGDLGSVTVAAGDAIQIRSLEAISGDVAFLGIPNQRGTQLAIDDYGPIQDFEVDLGTPLDDLCDSAGGQSAAQTIAADDQVVGVIGTSCSGAAVAAMPLISDAGLVMISASNTSPSLTSDLEGTAGADYQPGYFRTAHNDLFQGRAVAEFVFNEQGIESAAAIHDGDPYTQGLATAFADAFEELGGTITTVTAVNKGDTDMTGVLTEVGNGEPGALFFPIFMPEAGFIAQQIGDVGSLSDAVLISADGTLTDNFLELPETVGIYHSGPSTDFEGNSNEITGTAASDFLSAYEDEHGEAPSAPFWAHAYDATTLLLSAIDAVAEVDGEGNLVIDRQALRDELHSISGVSGIIGTLSCDEYGDCGAQQISIVEHAEGATSAEEVGQAIIFEYAPE